jgi:flagellar L-ring protein precursor FlgH
MSPICRPFANKLLYTLLITFSFLALNDAQTVQAQLWDRRSPNYRSPILDNRARAPGDTIVIEVNESSDVQNKDRRLLNKTGRSASAASGSFSLANLFGTATGGFEGEQQSSGSRLFNGNTETTIERALGDRFSVTVTDVLPNGNMLVTGKRSINLDGDVRSIYLSGIVRQVDVTAANTVPSQKIAQLNIEWVSEGPESKFTKQSWLGRSANKWFPF